MQRLQTSLAAYRLKNVPHAKAQSSQRIRREILCAFARLREINFRENIETMVVFSGTRSIGGIDVR